MTAEQVRLGPMVVTQVRHVVTLTPPDSRAVSEVATAILGHFGLPRRYSGDRNVEHDIEGVRVHIEAPVTLAALVEAAELYAGPHGYDYTVEVSWRSVAGASAATTTAIDQAAARGAVAANVASALR